MHDFSIYYNVIDTQLVPHVVRWVCNRGNLNLPPFPVRGHKAALGCAIFKLSVDALLVDAAFSLNQWRFCGKLD